MLLNSKIEKVDVQVCSRCIYDERVDGIEFDENGICNYCHQIDDLKKEYGTGANSGIVKLHDIIDELKIYKVDNYLKEQYSSYNIAIKKSTERANKL